MSNFLIYLLLSAYRVPIVSGLRIVTDPVDTTLKEGGSFTLSIVAAGYPAVQYQWRKNGIDIVEATSASYTVTGAVIADSGTYMCHVYNSENTEGLDSENAIVSVTAQDNGGGGGDPDSGTGEIDYGLLIIPYL